MLPLAVKASTLANTSAYFLASKSAWISLAVLPSFPETFFVGSLRVAIGYCNGWVLALLAASALRWRMRSPAAAADPVAVSDFGLSL